MEIHDFVKNSIIFKKGISTVFFRRNSFGERSGDLDVQSPKLSIG